MHAHLPEGSDLAEILAWLAAGVLVLALVNTLGRTVPVHDRGNGWPLDEIVNREPGPGRSGVTELTRRGR